MRALYTMVTNSDIFKGAIIGPLVAFPILLLFTIEQNNLFQSLVGSFVSASFSLIIIYPFVFLYGVPIAVILNKYNQFKPYYLCAASILPVVMFFGFSPTFITISMGVSFCSWWIAQRTANGV